MSMCVGICMKIRDRTVKMLLLFWAFDSAL